MENIPKANPPEYYLKIATDYEEKAKKAKNNKDSIYYLNLKKSYMNLYNERIKQEKLKEGILKKQNNNNKVSYQSSIVNDTFSPLHKNTLDNQNSTQPTNDTLNPLHENTLDNQKIEVKQPTNDTLKPLNNQTIEVKQPTIQTINDTLNNRKIEVKQPTIDTLNPLHENTLNNKTPEVKQLTNDTSINHLNLDKILKKTRKNNKKLVNTNAEIEMQTLSKPQLNVPIPINTKLGFRETLKMRVSKQKPVSVLNPNICQNIFMNGSKVTKKYFYPSEFPKLTKIKPITLSIKKGGKRKQKNTNKRYTRRNYINKQ
jgi:hypothetical protein